MFRAGAAVDAGVLPTHVICAAAAGCRHRWLLLPCTSADDRGQEAPGAQVQAIP